MKRTGTLNILILLSTHVALLAGSIAPATAVTADLAIKCRGLALKAHPPHRVGAKSGSAAEERAYYQACLAKGGLPPDEKEPKPAPPPPPAPER